MKGLFMTRLIIFESHTKWLVAPSSPAAGTLWLWLRIEVTCWEIWRLFVLLQISELVPCMRTNRQIRIQTSEHLTEDGLFFCWAIYFIFVIRDRKWKGKSLNALSSHACYWNLQRNAILLCIYYQRNAITITAK